MHFLLTTLKVVYVLTTPMPELVEDATVEVIRIRAKWENDNYICRGHILNGMSDSIFDVYTNVESAKELWDSLESKYMAEDSSSKKFLISNFNNYKMVDSRPVMEQYNELLRILGQYTQHGLKMDESISVSSIIDKFPPSWKESKHTLKHGKDDLSLVQLGSHLRIEESLRAQDSDNGKGKEVGGPSVNMTEEGKKKHNKQNKGKKWSNENNSGSSFNKKPKLECWKCGKTGHFKRDCRNGKKNNANAGGSRKGSKDHSQNQGQNLVNVWNSFVKYYVSLISEAFYMQVDAIAWWIDSGATTHVCKDHCWFKTFKPVEDGSVLYMGDEHYAPVHGKGSVVLEFSSVKTITLSNVLYVPKLRKNLVSGPVLNKCGYKQVYESDKYILSKCGVFVGFGYYNNGMFMLNLNKVPDDSDSVYMSSSTVVNSTLWHARLGHVHYKRMLEMSKDDLIPAIDENLEKCTTCMLTKITRQPFKSITRKSVILELIHSDLCDFHATPSLGNKKYVITFIDDASRFCYVYLLHAKDEALDKFRIYKTEVELQQNDLVKTLRTDRGGEYYDPIFFQSVGIIHETTAPYTPQQNGVAERKNRALKEMVNSMLSYSGLSEGFWGEAMAVVRLPDPKWKTLGEKGIDFIFVGYAEHSKAYRFYVIKPNDSVSINSIIESRDAIFDENHFSLIPKSKDIIPNLEESQRDDHSDDVPTEIPEPRRDPRTYNEAMQSRDAAFWKETIDDEIGSIMENNTWVLSDLPPGFRQKEGIDYFDTYAPVARITTIRLLLALAAIHNLVIHQMDVKTAFLNGDLDEEVYMKQPEGFVMPVDKTKKFLSSRFSMKDMGEADVILDCSSVSTPMDLVEKLKPHTGKPVDQLEYSRAIGCLMYAMISTRPDIAYVVGRLKGYSDASWINHVEDSSSTSGWVFLLGGALADAGKEAEWLRNLIHEIPIWLKPIAPISI
ncbi:zinc finger, CCHC-type containing protein [Tanacetum coccineum]